MKKLKFCLITILLLATMALPSLASASNKPLFNGFYAIKSFDSKEHIKGLNTITYGWSRVTYGEDNNIVFTSESNPLSAKDKHSEYHLPEGYQKQVLDYAERVNPQAKEYLQVFTADKDLLIKLLKINDNQLMNQVVKPMLKMVNDLELDGVVIDFEGLTSNSNDRNQLAERFNNLLTIVNKELGSKELIVTIPPRTINGSDQGYAYDYRTIGQLADTVILMAHDYAHQNNGAISIAGSAPYYLVKEAVVDAVKMIPADKLMLQVSLSVEQWTKSAIGFKLNTPTMEMLNAALNGENGQILNSNAGKGYITTDPKYNNKLYNLGYSYLQRKQLGAIVDSYFYYENSRSILSKINLAAQYNLKGLSIWRLGLSDINTWNNVTSYMQANENGWAYGFTDVGNGHWADQDILEMAARGVFKGYGDKHIKPNQPTTRAQFAQFLASALNIKPQTNENPFSDITPKNSYYESLVAAYESGIVGGYPDGTMRPNDLVNREQMAAMMMRAWQYLGESTPAATPLTYQDKQTVAGYAQEAISQTHTLEIISGYPDGTFKPKETATRAQSLVMINRMLNLAEAK